jgi:hypothetical protein
MFTTRLVSDLGNAILDFSKTHGRTTLTADHRQLFVSDYCNRESMARLPWRLMNSNSVDQVFKIAKQLHGEFKGPFELPYTQGWLDNVLASWNFGGVNQPVVVTLAESLWFNDVIEHYDVGTSNPNKRFMVLLQKRLVKDVQKATSTAHGDRMTNAAMVSAQSCIHCGLDKVLVGTYDQDLCRLLGLPLIMEEGIPDWSGNPWLEEQVGKVHGIGVVGGPGWTSMNNLCNLMHWAIYNSYSPLNINLNATKIEEDDSAGRVLDISWLKVFIRHPPSMILSTFMGDALDTVIRTPIDLEMLGNMNGVNRDMVAVVLACVAHVQDEFHPIIRKHFPMRLNTGKDKGEAK